MASHFFTNKNNNSLLYKFQGILENTPNFHSFDALIGYFRSSGYFKLRPHLEKIKKIRILVGINVDQLTVQYSDAGQQYLKDPEDTKEALIENLKKDIEDAEYNKEVESGILLFIEDIIEGRIQIKAHPEKNLHAKIYIFKPEHFNRDSTGTVITGSSNFTANGLGASEKSNYEFNVELRNYDDIKFASDEFELLWSEAIDILPIDAQRLKKINYINDEFTPFELYIKLLIEFFGQRIDYDPANVDLLLPDNYKRLTYQAEAAIEGYEKLENYNGVFLADVVGLGKTIIASIIAKKFIFENGYHSKILIVYPPALEDNWKKTIKDFQIWNNCSFISTGSLHKVIDNEILDYPNADEYDLIIIDEAHKFRNDTSNMYEKLQTITKTDRRIPGADGSVKKKVMLLTATPLNNHPADIENQVYLFQDKRNPNLPNVKNLQEFFTPLKEEYDKLKKDKVLNVRRVKEIFDKIRYKVVEPLVIRRSRTDILNNPEYLKDIKQQGIEFPEINPPNEVNYQFDESLSILFDRTITLLTGLDEAGKEVGGLGYYRYRAIEYLVNEEDRRRYGDVESISGRLSAIIKTLLVKRLESSFYAFKMSLSRLLKNTDHMIKMFEDDKIYVAPDIDVNKYLDEGNEEGLEAKINLKGGNNQIYQSKDFRNDFIPLLELDRKMVAELMDAWKKVVYDPKLEKFLFELKNSFLKSSVNHSGKLVIFTESKETMDYIEKATNEAGFKKTIGISANNRKENEKIIRLNFDANQDKEEWQNEFDIIFTTEVLAEGINLHRSNVIINYDVPWNSTRLMQRIGRVNRIGTEAKEINVFNFYPSDKSENQIKLTQTAIKKLQAFHSAFGEDSQIYSQLEEVGEAGLYGSKLKEEINETLLFLQELRTYKKENKKEFDIISKIPKKARLARNSEIVKSQDVAQCSVTYIKSNGHPGVFYKSDINGIVHELTFVEAAKIFRATKLEKDVKPLPEFHHEQVNRAIEYFKGEVKLSINSKVNKKTLSAIEKRVLSVLPTYAAQVKDPYYKQVLKRTIDELYKGSHRKLPNNIDTFIKKAKQEKINDLEIWVDKLYKEVLAEYKFNDVEPDNNNAKVKKIFAKPQIVISESFN
ncbi:MAG: phospholipase D-like domain-containing protein [Cyclobacteriaceae bacterium]|nr:DEAD/DEAH box helicase family protein [Cyclobacteriaceae bacterium]MCH8517188.1 phospholipase D-like domain-containing protein [Cyclobacteriaceae bacterium]